MAFFAEKSWLVRNNGGKYCRSGQATKDNTIWLMRFSCWIPGVTNINSEYVILFVNVNNSYSNAPQCYVIRTMPVLLNMFKAKLSAVRCYKGVNISTEPKNMFVDLA